MANPPEDREVREVRRPSRGRSSPLPPARLRLERALLFLFLSLSSAVGVREARAQSAITRPGTSFFACLSVCSTGLRRPRMLPPPCRTCLLDLSREARRLIGG